MRSRSISIALLSCVFALMFCLVGCGGSSGSAASVTEASSSAASADTVAASKDSFTGTWELSGVEENGEKVGQDELDALKSRGLEVYFNIEEGGSAALVLFGESIEGSWEPKTATEATFTYDGQSVPVTLEGGTLVLVESGSKLSFTKGEKRETPVAGSADSSASSEVAGLRDAVEADEAESKTTIDPVVIADDDNALVEVVATGSNVLDDPCYYLNVTNRLDRAVRIVPKAGSFTVNGVSVNPYTDTVVGAGGAVEEPVVFDEAEVGGGVEKLVAVKGTLELRDDATGDKIAEYAFQM